MGKAKKLIGPRGGIRFLVKCKLCSNQYVVSEKRIKSGTGRYCSMSCNKKANPVKYWLGKHRSDETRKILSKKLKGRRCSPATEFKKGNPGPWLGKAREHMRNEKNWNWKGDDASLSALHDWIRLRKGRPNLCEECGLSDKNRMYHWANISGDYKRDLDDFRRMCVPCHKRYDLDRLNKLRNEQ